MSPEEDRTRDTVDSEPKHYQLSYSGPQPVYMTPYVFLRVLWTIHKVCLNFVRKLYVYVTCLVITSYSSYCKL